MGPCRGQSRPEGALQRPEQARAGQRRPEGTMRVPAEEEPGEKPAASAFMTVPYNAAAGRILGSAGSRAAEQAGLGYTCVAARDDGIANKGCWGGKQVSSNTRSALGPWSGSGAAAAAAPRASRAAAADVQGWVRGPQGPWAMSGRLRGGHCGLRANASAAYDGWHATGYKAGLMATACLPQGCMFGLIQGI